MIVQETLDYSVFKTHPSNRKKDEALLKRLEQSIKKSNRLKSKPIIANKAFFIIDGQHRLEVAKRMGIPIPYVIDEQCNIEDIANLNNNQKSWTLTDYLNFHYHQRKSEYVKLKDFMDREQLALNISLQLLHACRTVEFFSNFKEGTYKFPTQEEFNEVIVRKNHIRQTIEFVKRKTSGPKTYLDRVTFYGALVDFFNIKSFDYETFMKKLQYKIDILHPCSKQLEYLKLFKDIYNWKNTNPIESRIQEN